MRTEAILTVISIILYLMLLFGIGMLCYERLRIGAARIRMFRRLAARKTEFRETRNFELRLRGALQAALGKPVPPNLFLGFLAVVFLAVFVSAIRSFTLPAALLISMITAIMPCLLLWARLASVRQNGSHEGETLITGMLREYRICGFNICETMEKVLETQSGLKVTRKLIFTLLLRLRETGDLSRIRNATDEFGFALGTNWGKMLSHNIFTAAGKGTDVSLAIEDILIQLRDAKAAAEERKRLNSEAIRMTCFLVPILYGATVVMAVGYLDLPIARFLDNQFGTREGLIFFLLIAFLFVLNNGLLTLIVKQKYDY